MEPISAIGALAKTAALLKDWPLWLFTAVALTLTVFSSTEEFWELLPPAGGRAIAFVAIAAWIFTGCRAVAPGIRAFHAYRDAAAARIRFVSDAN